MYSMHDYRLCFNLGGVSADLVQYSACHLQTCYTYYVGFCGKFGWNRPINHSIDGTCRFPRLGVVLTITKSSNIYV